MRYQMICRKEADGWSAYLEEAPGVISQGANLSQLRSRMKSALRLAKGRRHEALAVYTLQYKISEGTDDAVVRATADRQEFLEARRVASQSIRQAIRRLAEVDGFSKSDIAAILGLTKQRVHQLTR